MNTASLADIGPGPVDPSSSLDPLWVMNGDGSLTVLQVLQVLVACCGSNVGAWLALGLKSYLSIMSTTNKKALSSSPSGFYVLWNNTETNKFH